MKLLTPGAASAKVAHGDLTKYEARIMYLSPHNAARLGTVCTSSSRGCRATCLYWAGRGRFSSVQSARVARTELLKKHPQQFAEQLSRELNQLSRKAWYAGRRPVCRLNGTSDLDWRAVYAAHPEIQFYEYTKHRQTVLDFAARRLPQNLHVTFSRSETNSQDCQLALNVGLNVTVVFRDNWWTKIARPTWLGYPVIDGDAHDFRFLDPAGPRIVALKAKGRAKKDKTGFVV